MACLNFLSCVVLLLQGQNVAPHQHPSPLLLAESLVHLSKQDATSHHMGNDPEQKSLETSWKCNLNPVNGNALSAIVTIIVPCRGHHDFCRDLIERERDSDRWRYGQISAIVADHPSIVQCVNSAEKSRFSKHERNQHYDYLQ